MAALRWIGPVAGIIGLIFAVLSQSGQALVVGAVVSLGILAATAPFLPARWMQITVCSAAGGGVVVKIGPQLAEYLKHTQDAEDATWWSSPGLPPGAHSVADVTVTRDMNPKLGGVCD